MSTMKLFLDLDGVLADFDRAVTALFGRPPSALPPGLMWGRLAKAPDFYNTLPWMLDGRELWNWCRPFEPTILTGLPLGKWAEPQKRAWCQRELGNDVTVITCMSKEKHLKAREAVGPDLPMVLVDDRLKLREDWEAAGGIFVHHLDTSTSIAQLRELGFGA